MSKSYHVYSRQNGSWAVRPTQSARAQSVHATMAAAISAARQIARTHGAEMVVHALDGKVSERENYALATL
jgi:hypothetical protein